jgi:hypothetical protein
MKTARFQNLMHASCACTPLCSCPRVGILRDSGCHGWTTAARPNTKEHKSSPMKLRIILRLAAKRPCCGSDRRRHWDNVVADVRCPALPLAIIYLHVCGVGPLAWRDLACHPPWVTYNCGHGRLVICISIYVSLVPFPVIQTLFLSYHGFIPVLIDIY